MKVLGLDPGSRASGYGLVEYVAGRASALAYGVWRPPSPEMSGRLGFLFTAAEEFLEKHGPDAASIETVFAGKNIASMLALSQARGVLLLACARAGVPVYEYEPLTVKKTVTGYGRAEKPQLRTMVISLLSGVTGGLALDAADALAVALCHCHHLPPASFDRGPTAC